MVGSRDIQSNAVIKNAIYLISGSEYIEIIFQIKKKTYTHFASGWAAVVGGWLRKKRMLREIEFISLRDDKSSLTEYVFERSSVDRILKCRDFYGGWEVGLRSKFAI